MRSAEKLMPALGDDAAALDQHAADHGIGRHGPASALGQGQGAAHETDFRHPARMRLVPGAMRKCFHARHQGITATLVLDCSCPSSKKTHSSENPIRPEN